MAKGAREKIKLESTAGTGFFYTTTKNKQKTTGKLELKKWFDVVVCIESCNCAKPNKQIFLYALDRLGIEPSEAVFVGDSVEQDYEGAFNVGIRPFLVDRENKHPSHFNKISSLTELLTII